MRVLIALTSSSGQLSGVQRHAINLARCLLTRSDITAVHLVAAPWQQDFVRDIAPHDDPRLHLHTASVGNTSMSRNLWYYSGLPRMAARLQPDIVHLAYPVPLRSGAYSCPTVVTLHDLYPYDVPANFGFPKVLFNQLVLQRCLHLVNSIACVSTSTVSRLERIEPGLAQKKATVVCNCVEPHPRVSPLSPLPQWKGEPFLLCVAQHRRNKNILFLLRVFHRLLLTRQLAAGTRLVIVGIPGPETKAILRFLAATGIADRVVLRNGISDDELQWCYRRCDALLAPSIVEGFGLPVAEALLAGCRVVCSDIAAFRELGGEYCRYVPVGFGAEPAFADAVSAALREPPHKPICLPQLSAQFIAEQYVQLYRSLLIATPAPHSCLLPGSIQTTEGNSAL
jgi:glycosyltransferase involved in cell wall biosynthesis